MFLLKICIWLIPLHIIVPLIPPNHQFRVPSFAEIDFYLKWMIIRKEKLGKSKRKIILDRIQNLRYRCTLSLLPNSVWRKKKKRKKMIIPIAIPTLLLGQSRKNCTVHELVVVFFRSTNCYSIFIVSLGETCTKKTFRVGKGFFGGLCRVRCQEQQIRNSTPKPCAKCSGAFSCAWIQSSYKYIKISRKYEGLEEKFKTKNVPYKISYHVVHLDRSLGLKRSVNITLKVLKRRKFVKNNNQLGFNTSSRLVFECYTMWRHWNIT